MSPLLCLRKSFLNVRASYNTDCWASPQSFWFNRSKWAWDLKVTNPKVMLILVLKKIHLPRKTLPFRSGQLKCCLNHNAFLYPPPPTSKVKAGICVLQFHGVLSVSLLIIFDFISVSSIRLYATEDGFMLQPCLYLLWCLLLHFIVKELCKYVLNEVVYSKM